MAEFIQWYRERGILCTKAPTLNGIFVYEPMVRLFGDASIYRTAMGAYSYVAGGGSLIEARIGRYCSVGGRCNIGMSSHPLDHLTTSPFPYEDVFQVGTEHDSTVEKTEQLTIGHDVWIGTDTKIIGGNKIGTGAVIAAGSIVTKDVPPYAIMAGNPANLKRLRFNEKTIKRLLTLKWWDYDLVDAHKRGIEIPWQTPLKAADAIEAGVERGDIKSLATKWNQVRLVNGTVEHEIQDQ